MEAHPTYDKSAYIGHEISEKARFLETDWRALYEDFRADAPKPSKYHAVYCELCPAAVGPAL
jgi:hypothetical protein